MNEANKNRIKDTFYTLGIEYTQDKQTKLEKYMEAVLELNKSINMTAITQEDEFVEKHYIDSMLIAKEDIFV